MALMHIVPTQYVFSIVSRHNTEVRTKMRQDIIKAVGEQFDEATVTSKWEIKLSCMPIFMFPL